MIEIVSSERCTACNICVSACPTNVFDIVPGGPPRIARQSDCQTCFMCELYCPEDALYVAPSADAPMAIDEHAPDMVRLLGSYRRNLGWARGQQPAAAGDKSFELLIRAH